MTEPEELNGQTGNTGVQVWWANHGRTFSKARDGGFLWAPLPPKSGVGFPYWESLIRVKPGDIVLNYAGGGIVSVGKALGEAVNHTEEAKSKKNKGKEGWRVDIEFYDLDQPISIDLFKNHITDINMTVHDNRPFNALGNVNNGYLFDFSTDGLKIILSLAGDAFPEMVLTWFDAVLPQDFISYLRQDGLVYDENAVRQFITALHAGSPVLLTGPPGAGKSSLPLKYARYVSGIRRAKTRIADDTALRQRRWYKLSYNDKELLNAFQGDGRKIDRVRQTMLGDGLVPVGWENRDLHQKKIIKELRNGDVIVAYEGAYTIGGIGIVTHPHFFDETGDAYDTFCESSKNFIRVEWIFSGPLKIKDFTFKEYNIPGFGMWKEAIYLMAHEQVEQFDTYLKRKGIRLSSKEYFVPPESCAMVPVQADWVNGKSILGEIDRRTGEYHSTAVLDHILNAGKTLKAGIDFPFFLIFDEMNLSCIDHYFADFLSALESDEPIRLHDSDTVEQREGIPKLLRLPENLFIAGTLNQGPEATDVSAKVIDRCAIVRLKSEPAVSYLKKCGMRYFGRELPLPSQTELKRMMAPVVLEMMEPVRVDEEDDIGLTDRIVAEVDLFQAVLGRFDFRVSKRTINYILRYIYTDWTLAGRPALWYEWCTAADAVLMLKVMPGLTDVPEYSEHLTKLLYCCCFSEKEPGDVEALKNGTIVESLLDKKPEEAAYPEFAGSLKTIGFFKIKTP